MCLPHKTHLNKMAQSTKAIVGPYENGFFSVTIPSSDGDTIMYFEPGSLHIEATAYPDRGTVHMSRRRNGEVVIDNLLLADVQKIVGDVPTAFFDIGEFLTYTSTNCMAFGSSVTVPANVRI